MSMVVTYPLEVAGMSFLEKVASELLSVSVAIKPFMPETAKVIEERFTAKEIKKGKPLFPRI